MVTTVSSEESKTVSAVELAAAAAQGNDDAFVDLYGLFSQRIFNMVLRSVHDRGMAEDLCQEIWLKVHHEIRSLRAPEAVRSWLYRIASRACIDFARSSRATRASGEELLDEVAQAYDPMPEDAAIQGSQVRMVWETLATMAPRQGIALYLKQVDGRSYDEIGSILNCSRETVESLLFRARQSFVRAYDRVQSSPVQRCSMFQQVVADVVDNEPTQLQKGAIHAHLQECRPCRIQLPDMAAAAKGYGMLPLLPLTKGIVLQAILGGAVAGTAIGVAPSTTGGIVAGLSLKAKLAAIFGLLAAGATGAVTTHVVNVPLVPGIGAIFREHGSQPDNTLLITGNNASPAQGSTNPAGSDNNGSGSNADTRSGAAGPRGAESAGSGDSSAGGQRLPAPPAAPGAGSGTSGGSSVDAETGQGGASAPGGGIVPGVTPPPVETVLQDPVGTLGGVVNGALGAVDNTLEDLDGVVGDTVGVVDDTLGGVGETVGDVIEPLDPLLDDVLPGDALDDVVEDTLDEVLPPPDEGSGPVEDLIDDVGDVLDEVLPGEGEDEGPLGDILDPILEPGGTPPPSGTPEPDATEPPGCVLIILC